MELSTATLSFSELPPYPGSVQEISGDELHERVLALKPITP